MINKRRKRVNQATAGYVIGDVNGRICLMFDDMIDTGGTICEGARALKKHGATAVYAACTHAVLSDKDGEQAEEKLLGEIEEMMAEREPVYLECADLVIDGTRPPQELAAAVVAAFTARSEA